MPNVLDVAAYILEIQGEMTAMKLQKLVYYSQAWSLVWDDQPIFAEPIQAWANGPVCPQLYDHHRGKFQLHKGDIGGDIGSLNEEQRETIDMVLRDYGERSAQWLSDLTHAEEPWKMAWGERKFNETCDVEIAKDSMLEYYSRILYAPEQEDKS